MVSIILNKFTLINTNKTIYHFGLMELILLAHTLKTKVKHTHKCVQFATIFTTFLLSPTMKFS
jgi:hypothetical protein